MSSSSSGSGSSSAKVTRRQVIDAGKITGAVAAIGSVSGYGAAWATAPQFVKDVQKGSKESRAKSLRNDAQEATKFYNKEVKGIPGSISLNIDAYSDRGRFLTDNFILSTSEENEVQRNVDEDNAEFSALEGTNKAGATFEDVKNTLDRDDDGVTDVPLSEDQEKSLQNTLEEFSDIRLYVQENEQNEQPLLSEEAVGELKALKKAVDADIQKSLSYLSGDFDGITSPAEIAEGGNDLIDEVDPESSQTNIGKYVNLLGFTLQGQEFKSKDRFSKQEAKALVEGEGKYSGYGVDETTDKAEELINRVTEGLSAGMAMSNIFGYALQQAGEDVENYGDGEYGRSGERQSTETPTETDTETPTPTETGVGDQYNATPPSECEITEDEVLDDLGSQGYDVDGENVFYQNQDGDLEVFLDKDGDGDLDSNPLEYASQCG